MLWPTCRSGCSPFYLEPLASGIGTTGSLGVLVDAVNVKRIVTAMVVWSQIGIVGYLIGPLIRGAVAEVLGYPTIGAVAALAGIAVLAAMIAARPITLGTPKSRPD